MSAKWFWAGMCSALWIGGALHAQSTNLNSTDKQFLKMAAETSMTQAHLGQMAETQASEDMVKQLGKTLDQDYTRSYSDLTGVAAKAGESIPNGINAAKNRAIAQLMHMKGKSFDRTFVRDEIQDQQKVLTEFKREADHGENPAIKAYATEMMPTIENHLHEAQNLAKTAKHA